MGRNIKDQGEALGKMYIIIRFCHDFCLKEAKIVTKPLKRFIILRNETSLNSPTRIRNRSEHEVKRIVRRQEATQ